METSELIFMGLVALICTLLFYILEVLEKRNKSIKKRIHVPSSIRYTAGI